MVKASAPPATAWAFRARFRRGAFGWRGTRLAVLRLSEALSEIRAVARHDPAAAGEGAVLLLEKLSPALSHVDSSSGALGDATYSAVQEMVPTIAGAPVSVAVRKRWLERLFEAIQEDDPPYIESLGNRWGDLCATPELASSWADELLPTLRRVQQDRKNGTYAYFSGTGLCNSALFTAGRHDELLEMLAMDPRPIWPYLVWGGHVLVARGQVDEAIAYVRERDGSTTSEATVARFAEDALLKAGRRAEAFDQYALLANQANSNLSTFRAIAKKYPEIQPNKLLGFLVASTPGEPGKWFATAKTVKLFDQATALAWASPCDPKTLTRAARDHLISRPAFAMQSALAALHWISMGHGYELTGLDVLDAYRLATDAARSADQINQAEDIIKKVLAIDRPITQWMRQSLGIGGVPAGVPRRG